MNFFEYYKELHKSFLLRESVLSAKDIGFYWNRLAKEYVFRNVNIDIKSSELMSVFGGTGSGKSTLAHVLAGRVMPVEGSVYLNKHKILYSNSAAAIQQKASIQLMPQIPILSFNPMLTLSRALHDSYKMFSYRILKSDIFNILKNKYDRKDSKDFFNSCVHFLCEQLDISIDILSRLPAEVSGGQLQRIAFIRALLVFPDVFILDEPVSHLDINVRLANLKVIQKIRTQTNISIVLISHLYEVHEYFRHTNGVCEYKLHGGNLIKLDN